jgi:hypothetical protein
VQHISEHIVNLLAAAQRQAVNVSTFHAFVNHACFMHLIQVAVELQCSSSGVVLSKVTGKIIGKSWGIAGLTRLIARFMEKEGTKKMLTMLNHVEPLITLRLCKRAHNSYNRWVI